MDDSDATNTQTLARLSGQIIGLRTIVTNLIAQVAVDFDDAGSYVIAVTTPASDAASAIATPDAPSRALRDALAELVDKIEADALALLR